MYANCGGTVCACGNCGCTGCACANCVCVCVACAVAYCGSVEDGAPCGGANCGMTGCGATGTAGATWLVHATPSQYRTWLESAGSGYQFAGITGCSTYDRVPHC